MNTKSFPINRNRAKKLKSDTNNAFTPVQTTQINKRCKHSIVSPSELSLLPERFADVQAKPQLDIVSLKTSQQVAPVSVAEAIAFAERVLCTQRCCVRPWRLPLREAQIAKMLEDMGVQYAFGVSGGAIGSATAPWAIASGGGFRIAPLWHAQQHSDIRVLHIHHEAGAAFAATEAYFASGCPVMVFTTTSLGITNALTTQIFLHRDRNLTMLPLKKCSEQLW